MNLSDFVLSFLAKKKIKNVFLITCGAISFMVDAFSKNNKIKTLLEKILRSNMSEFVEVMLKPDQKIIPKLQFGNPIEDCSPLFPRDEFQKNMLVKQVLRSDKIFEEN